MVEIDVASENVGQLSRYRVRKADGIGRGEQRRPDFVGAELQPHRRLWDCAPGDERDALAIRRAIDGEQLAVRREGTQRYQPAFAVGQRAKRSAWPKLVERARSSVGAQKTLRRGIVDPQPGEHAAQRIPAADLLLAPVALVGLGQAHWGQHQVADDALARNALQRRIGRQCECRDTAQRHQRQGRDDAHHVHAGRGLALR